VTPGNIAKREKCSVRKVNMTISLAFLAPDLVKAAIDGRLPHGMGVTRLADLPAEWSEQHQILGLSQQWRRIQTNLCLARSLLPGNGILRLETKAPKSPSGADVATRRDPAPARKPANAGLFAKTRENLR
jgi:hypothetical protein